MRKYILRLLYSIPVVIILLFVIAIFGRALPFYCTSDVVLTRSEAMQVARRQLENYKKSANLSNIYFELVRVQQNVGIPIGDVAWDFEFEVENEPELKLWVMIGKEGMVDLSSSEELASYNEKLRQMNQAPTVPNG